MADTSDFEKLSQAFGDLATIFGSWENLLDSFGLLHMPVAQRYGILFGCITFTVTITTVLCLLTVGGSFRRIAEQQTGDVTVPHAHTARAERALLLEHLLDARERMLRHYPPPQLVPAGCLSGLTTLLLNVAPKIVPVDNEEKKDGDDGTATNTPATKREFPQDYQDNYSVAYRRCQDVPGGPQLSGRPEARFEAYARGYAGCGSYTSLSYRRSYARLYEAISCDTHKSDDKYSTLFETRPQDIIGKRVRLEGLEEDRHLKNIFDLTSGESNTEKAFNPQEVWGFQEHGPFKNAQEMRKSFVFQRKINEAAFAIVNNITDKVMGLILLTNDNPQHLGIQFEAPIMRPSMDGSAEQLEACFLLLDRLVALGYRRIQMICDSQDGVSRKLALRLGFTLEGTMYKHMIHKDASRDSIVYGLLNSDWDKGARYALFRKLHGKAAASADLQNKKKEEELDEQKRVLAEKEAEETATKDKNL